MSISDLSGRCILVTGASSGIGAATCRALLGCGASVAMLARRNDRPTALSAELGERAIGIQSDVTELDTLSATVARVVDTLGASSVAGVTTPPKPDAVADTIAFMLGLPEDVCINELVLRPTAQLRP